MVNKRITITVCAAELQCELLPGAAPAPGRGRSPPLADGGPAPPAGQPLRLRRDVQRRQGRCHPLRYRQARRHLGGRTAHCAPVARARKVVKNVQRLIFFSTTSSHPPRKRGVRRTKILSLSFLKTRVNFVKNFVGVVRNALLKGVWYFCKCAGTRINTADIILWYFLKFIFAKRGGGWTTTPLYVHCTFFVTADL